MDEKFKPGDAVTFKKLADKKIIQVDTEKQEALCEGLTKKGEKKIVWIPLRLLKLQKKEAGTEAGKTD